jgi:hypothetical protein
MIATIEETVECSTQNASRNHEKKLSRVFDVRCGRSVGGRLAQRGVKGGPGRMGWPG